MNFHKNFSFQTIIIDEVTEQALRLSRPAACARRLSLSGS